MRHRFYIQFAGQERLEKAPQFCKNLHNSFYALAGNNANPDFRLAQIRGYVNITYCHQSALGELYLAGEDGAKLALD